MNTFFIFIFSFVTYNATICITKMNHHHILHRISLLPNRIGGVMVNMLASSEVDRGFEPRSGQINDYKIDICCFFTKHEALGRKSKDLLDRNQDNVSEWGDMLTRRLLF
jgi:hypothetical protein